MVTLIHVTTLKWLDTFRKDKNFWKISSRQTFNTTFPLRFPIINRKDLQYTGLETLNAGSWVYIKESILQERLLKLKLCTDFTL